MENLEKFITENEICTVFVDSLVKLNYENQELLQTSLELVSFLTERYDSKELNIACRNYTEAVKNKTVGLVEGAVKWLDQYNMCVTTKLIDFLNRSVLPDEIAHMWFSYFHKTRFITSDSAKLLYEFAQKFKRTLPLHAFELCMHLINIFPDMCNHKDRPYKYSSEYAQTEFEKCPICGGEGTPYFMANAFIMAHFSEPHLPFKLWMECDTCENLYSRFIPKSFTDLSFESKIVTPIFDENYTATCSSIMFAKWCEVINNIQKCTKLDRVLEVGVGNGAFIATALEMNIPIDAVEIIEESAQSISNLLNIDIHCMDFLTYKSPHMYNAIFMGDVIEHVTDPKKALRVAHELLENDGVLWLSTPNFNSAFSKFYKYRDPMWSEPTHITYFSYSGFEKIANECGFVISEYVVSNRYNGSMELLLTKI